MKTVWLSANKLGYELLKEALKIKDLGINAVVTLSNSSSTIMYDDAENKKWHSLDIDVHEIDRLNENADLIKGLSPDLIIVCGWRQLISEDILSIPARGVVGFHPTMLPYGRGPAPIINTILKGETVSGLSMFYVTKGLDDGDIIAQKEFRIEKDDHANDVYDKIIKAGKHLVKKYLPQVARGYAPRTSQDDSMAVNFDKTGLDSNKIDLEKESLEQVYRKIKALSRPYKGAYIEKDNKRLIIWQAELQDM